mmetsp:Transcript_39210/g.58249  ORF Transcript_39210/g.58249 Transcript_39210/m.58249 type:complete len:97 (-) Transcript_39210:170-460(-)
MEWIATVGSLYEPVSQDACLRVTRRGSHIGNAIIKGGKTFRRPSKRKGPDFVEPLVECRRQAILSLQSSIKAKKNKLEDERLAQLSKERREMKAIQ